MSKNEDKDTIPKNPSRKYFPKLIIISVICMCIFKYDNLLTFVTNAFLVLDVIDWLVISKIINKKMTVYSAHIGSIIGFFFMYLTYLLHTYNDKLLTYILIVILLFIRLF